jgi:ankyrin repeat protein
MWAAGLGHSDVVQWLLVEQHVPVDAEDKRGRTALMQAAKHCELICFQALLAGGADVHRMTADGSAVMDWACMGGNIPVIQHVLSLPGIDMGHENKFRCTAIHWACSAGDVETCRWMYRRGFDFTAVNDANHGAVNVAAWRGHRDVVEWALLDPHGPNLIWQLAIVDPEGRSLVQLTTIAGHLELAKWLQRLSEPQS